jgi:hypothetical protein
MNKAYRQEEDPNHLAEVLKGQPTVDVRLPSPRPPHCCPPVSVLTVSLTVTLQEMTTLRVSLTSKPVGWIAQWIEAGGLVNFAKLLSCTYTLYAAHSTRHTRHTRHERTI